MEGCSAGLEVFLELGEEEFSRLVSEVLKGKFLFRGIGFEADVRREIPFELEYLREQREPLEVVIEPAQVYFADVDSVRFSINGGFYNTVKTYGSCGARFFTSGKLTIRHTKLYNSH